MNYHCIINTLCNFHYLQAVVNFLTAQPKYASETPCLKNDNYLDKQETKAHKFTKYPRVHQSLQCKNRATYFYISIVLSKANYPTSEKNICVLRYYLMSVEP